MEPQPGSQVITSQAKRRWCTRFFSELWPSRRILWSLCRFNSSSLRFVTLYHSAVDLTDMGWEAWKNCSQKLPRNSISHPQRQMFFLKGEQEGLGTLYLILYSFPHPLSTFILSLLFFWSMGSRPDAQLSHSAISLSQTTSLSFVFLSFDSATYFASPGCFKVVFSHWYCSVLPHLWRCCPSTWITSLLLGTSCSSPSRVVLGLNWEVGAREEGGKERKEQKGTQRLEEGEGSPSGAIWGNNIPRKTLKLAIC